MIGRRSWYRNAGRPDYHHQVRNANRWLSRQPLWRFIPVMLTLNIAMWSFAV